MKNPLISICIPAYNRAEYLSDLLESISIQKFQNFEIVIAEDCSPEKLQIAKIVSKFQSNNPCLDVVYEENIKNLGYDGNIRCLFEIARGEFCLFLGNDDLLVNGALLVINDVISRNPECGVVVRSYGTFDLDPAIIKQEFRYFPQEHSIRPGENAVVTAFRRSVVIPGLVIHRESALKVGTSAYDGTLLYQLYLVGMILANRSVIFTPKIIALRRDGNLPDFGNSEAEKGKFIPHEQTVESSVYFVKGMFEIAKGLEVRTDLKVFARIRADIARYSYPILAIQAHRSRLVFAGYALSLCRLGLGRSPLFYTYFFALLVFGPQFMDKVVWYLKTKIGHAPRFGKIG